VEALVAITLFVVVASITGTLIVQAHKTTRRATSAAFTQSQLQDTVLRVAREVVVSDPITVALPTQLETVTVRGVATVRTRFWYKELDASNHTGEIRSISAATLPAEEITVGYKVIARNVTDRPTAPQGGTPKILAYVDGNSRPVGDGVHALSASELPKVPGEDQPERHPERPFQAIDAGHQHGDEAGLARRVGPSPCSA